MLIAAHPIVYGLLAAIVASLLWPAAERPGLIAGIFFGGSLVLSIPGAALARRVGAHHWRFHRLLRQQLAAELLRRRPP
ncbi:MAG: hypothetical protein A2V77_01750 [Anaeromyxobacter sp. RBG_16_69_14]|nr:MAG: hypothetical protein A2V77_01750 [Anaeromyxobacter sp. RBG_16_69_14]